MFVLIGTGVPRSVVPRTVDELPDTTVGLVLYLADIKNCLSTIVCSRSEVRRNLYVYRKPLVFAAGREIDSI